MVKVKNVLFGILVLLGGEAFCADPPAPTMMSSTAVPPPPGLPLPIDDYLPALMIAGILLGVFYFQRSRKLS